MFVSLERDRAVADSYFRAYLVGAYRGEQYLADATRHEAGEVDPANGTCFWTPCWNMLIRELVDMDEALSAWRQVPVEAPVSRR